MTSTVEQLMAWIAAVSGIAAAAFLLARSQPSWFIPVVALGLIVGSIGVVAGANIDTRRVGLAGRNLLRASTSIQAAGPFFSALSPILIGVALLTLTTAA